LIIHKAIVDSDRAKRIDGVISHCEVGEVNQGVQAEKNLMTVGVIGDYRGLENNN
jgi:hypothetical protein